jgi:ABC-type Fe3+ transport system permease subunit
MKRMITIMFTLLAIFSFNLVPSHGHLALADTASTIKGGACEAAGDTCPDKPGKTLNDTVATVINLLSIAAGIIAVIMIIVGGLRFTTSAGNPEAAKGARNTLTYAVIGLVIVALAQIIVHFVLYKLK